MPFTLAHSSPATPKVTTRTSPPQSSRPQQAIMSSPGFNHVSPTTHDAYNVSYVTHLQANGYSGSSYAQATWSESHQNRSHERPIARIHHSHSTHGFSAGTHSHWLSSVTPEQMAARETINTELPSFDGNIEDWPVFYSFYEETTSSCGFSSQENLIRLINSLKGKARQHVFGLLTVAENVPYLMERLKAIYGRPEPMAECQLAKIRRLPRISIERIDQLTDYGIAVNNLVNNKISHAHKYVHENRNSSPGPLEERPKGCLVCQEGCESLQDCRQFKELCRNAKWHIVKQNQLCIICLKRHLKSCCPTECGIDGCSRRHHPLLHLHKKDETTTTWTHNVVSSQDMQSQLPPIQLNLNNPQAQKNLTAPHALNPDTKGHLVHQDTVIKQSRKQFNVAHGINDVINSTSTPNQDKKLSRSLTHHHLIAPYSALSQRKFTARSPPTLPEQNSKASLTDWPPGATKISHLDHQNSKSSELVQVTRTSKKILCKAKTNIGYWERGKDRRMASVLQYRLRLIFDCPGL